mmetsp:Transcript_40120/g.67270  ORF Transcript_40120/g.67270 Transcript_40120/m.67270 type:complete len:211 (-) Transcript_40120:10-642(-)
MGKLSTCWSNIMSRHCCFPHLSKPRVCICVRNEVHIMLRLRRTTPSVHHCKLALICSSRTKLRMTPVRERSVVSAPSATNQDASAEMVVREPAVMSATPTICAALYSLPKASSPTSNVDMGEAARTTCCRALLMWNDATYRLNMHVMAYNPVSIMVYHNGVVGRRNTSRMLLLRLCNFISKHDAMLMATKRVNVRKTPHEGKFRKNTLLS